MNTLPKNIFSISKTTADSTHKWMLHSVNGEISYGFDYATRVANADRGEKVALYGGDGGYMSVAVQSVDATVAELNALLLDECEPFNESDIEG